MNANKQELTFSAYSNEELTDIDRYAKEQGGRIKYVKHEWKKGSRYKVVVEV
ncbi:hypothetical protein MUN88_19090 [Gracilibacillus caseinilyticus]|uniref:Phage protein n=1 Tax=Gracilibacillus caseinilyticus TaxID=2932256 RepID=A0ABY4EVX1_9BACI|nr:hypothetical protein [Gracilibacillus caseinilyticus]UOQ48125.1 hypothetical protein MUN88_19090 [Gracilibacillus caseinilyticus]